MDKNEWLEELRAKDRYKAFTDDQWECCQLIFDAIGGEHHLTAKIKDFGSGVQYNTFQDIATFDSNRLTTLVFLAHDKCIRFSIDPSGPRMLRWCFWKRKREGSMSQKHPDLDSAVKEFRKWYMG